MFVRQWYHSWYVVVTDNKKPEKFKEDEEMSVHELTSSMTVTLDTAVALSVGLVKE